MEKDMVNHPQHYVLQSAIVEPIVLCERAPFALGNAIKYMIRAGHKGSELEDLQKACWYLGRCFTSYLNGENREEIDKFFKNYGSLLIAFPGMPERKGFDALIVYAKERLKAIQENQKQEEEQMTTNGIKVKVKKIAQNALLPKRGTAGAAGLDLYCSQSVVLKPFKPAKVPTGLAFEIPDGYCGVVYSRSSSALGNLLITPLIVDSDYRGQVYVLVTNISNEPYEINLNDRVAQLRLEKVEPVDFEEVEELSKTMRGQAGYGSTGR